MSARQPSKVLKLKAGDWVEVRGQAEILATLDEHARFENLPLMPEMLQYCGQRFRVASRADKTCDPAHTPWSIRRMGNAVHLEGVRCGGEQHGGCQAGCLMWWKEAWLKRVSFLSPQSSAEPSRMSVGVSFPRSVDVIHAATRSTNAEGETVYSCQATDVRKFTSYMMWYDPRQYIRDVRSGNLCGGRALNSKSERLLELILGILQAIRSFFISFFAERRLLNYPAITGSTPKGPVGNLNLQPGELVQVRSKEEIIATLDKHRRNRGLLFDGEMLRYCDGIFTVLRRVDRIIDERTGKMIQMKYPSVILDGVACKSDYHRLCPRAIYHYWRESWLARVGEGARVCAREREVETCERV